MNRSRGECEKIIMRGEGVLLPDGRMITKLEDLPSSIELAGNDIVQKQFAVQELKDTIERAQKALAQAEGTPEAPAAKPEKPAPGKTYEQRLKEAVGTNVAKALTDNNIKTLEELQAATPEQVAALKLSEADVAKVREFIAAETKPENS